MSQHQNLPGFPTARQAPRYIQRGTVWQVHCVTCHMVLRFIVCPQAIDPDINVGCVVFTCTLARDMLHSLMYITLVLQLARYVTQRTLHYTSHDATLLRVPHLGVFPPTRYATQRHIALHITRGHVLRVPHLGVPVTWHVTLRYMSQSVTLICVSNLSVPSPMLHDISGCVTCHRVSR